MRKTPIIVIAAVLLVILFMLLFTFVQRPYEIVLLDRFGQIKEPTTLVRGWKLCLPTDRVVRIDRRNHLYTSILQQINTKSGPISVRTFAAWKIVDPEKFYKRLSGNDDNAQQNLNDKITGLVQQTFAAHRLDEIFNATAKSGEAEKFTEGLENAIRDQANVDLAGQGMKIEQVGFSRMAFPPSIADRVYSRMIEDRSKLARDARSAGAADADTIRADGQRLRDTAVAEAGAKASKLRGEGEKEAITILGEVMDTQSAKELYQFYRAMDMVAATFRTNTYLIFRADDSPFTRWLTNPPSPQDAGMQGIPGLTTRPAATMPAATTMPMGK